jgi:Zn-dependent protease with chaperone function
MVWIWAYNMISGQYFDGKSAKGKTASLSWSSIADPLVLLPDEKLSFNVEVKSIQGSQVFFIDGSSFMGNATLPVEFCAVYQSPLLNWIRQVEVFSVKKSIILGVCLILSLTVLRFSVVGLAPILTSLISQDAEISLGQEAYDVMYDQHFLPSKLSIEQRKSLQRSYDELWTESNLTHKPTLYFKQAPKIGANALAFPGGPIVVTDELVHLLRDNQLIEAVIAHELAHVEQRHSLQKVVIIAGSLAIASVIFGAEEGFSEELVAVAANVYAFQHSQRFELDSDQYAVDLLVKAGRDPLAMRQSLEVLMATSPDDDALSLFSTHPAKKERLAALAN